MNVLGANIASTHANNDTELDLVMDVRLIRVETQGLSGRQKRGKRFVKPHGLRWQRVIQLGDVRMVITPDADNLALVLVAEIALVQRLHSVELLVLTRKSGTKLPLGKELSQHSLSLFDFLVKDFNYKKF